MSTMSNVKNVQCQMSNMQNVKCQKCQKEIPNWGHAGFIFFVVLYGSWEALVACTKNKKEQVYAYI